MYMILVARAIQSMMVWPFGLQFTTLCSFERLNFNGPFICVFHYRLLWFWNRYRCSDGSEKMYTCILFGEHKKVGLLWLPLNQSWQLHFSSSSDYYFLFWIAGLWSLYQLFISSSQILHACRLWFSLWLRRLIFSLMFELQNFAATSASVHPL